MVTTGKLIDQYLYCVIRKFLLIFFYVSERTDKVRQQQTEKLSE